MSENSKFFKVIWRINAFFIFAIGLLAFCGFVLFASLLVKDYFLTPTHVNNVVNIDPTHEKTEEIKFGYTTVHDEVYRITVTKQQSYNQLGFSSSKATGSTINYLFVDSRTGKSSWLLSNNESVIEFTDSIHYQNDRQNQTIGFLYSIADKDSDDNKRINSADLKTLSVSNLTGSGYTVIDDNVQKFIAHNVLSKNRFSVLYQKNELLYMAEVTENNNNYTVSDKKIINLE